jgi:hypothetical protein
MAMRPGGEADKLGNSFEAAWTVLKMLEIVSGMHKAIYIEPLGDLGNKTEFVLYLNNGKEEVHQAKRNKGMSNSWSFAMLREADILEAMHKHTSSDRDYWLVTTLSCSDLEDIAGRARRSDTSDDFYNDLADGSKANLARKSLVDDLCTAQSSKFSFTNYDELWKTLRRFRTAGSEKEDGLNGQIRTLAACYLTGEPQSAVNALKEMAVQNLSQKLDRTFIMKVLKDTYKISSARPDLPSLEDKIKAIYDKWKQGVESQLIHPYINRTEQQSVIDTVPSKRVTLLSGSGGSGKSGILYTTAEHFKRAGRPVLAFRLDRLSGSVTALGLGEQWGLGMSPVAALIQLARDKNTKALITIDQLDAASEASGRMPELFELIEDIVNEASSFDEISILVGCRKFDAANDNRIQSLLSRDYVQEIEAKALSEGQTSIALEEMGVSVRSLSSQQLSIFCSPFTLKLVSEIPNKTSIPSIGSLTQLLDEYTRSQQRSCEQRNSKNFNEAIAFVATRMSEDQSLKVARRVIDRSSMKSDVDVMISCGVFVQEDGYIAFFHESYFDYAYARQWIDSGQKISDFLESTTQELFRRGQVRQMLALIHDEDPNRFISEVQSLFTNDKVKFHIQLVALAILSEQDRPTQSEAKLVGDFMQSRVPISDHFWKYLNSPGWFKALYDEGYISKWLISKDNNFINWTLKLCSTAMSARSSEVVGLLRANKPKIQNYDNVMRWLIRVTREQWTSEFLDLILEEIRRGLYNPKLIKDGSKSDLFTLFKGFSDKSADYLMLLLLAFFVEQPQALSVEKEKYFGSKISLLTLRESHISDAIRKVAKQYPTEFLAIFMPYFLKVLELTPLQHDSKSTFKVSVHFHHSYMSRDNLEEVLLSALGMALSDTLSESKTAEYLDALLADTHEASQWLLYSVLAKNEVIAHRYAKAALLDRRQGLYATSDGQIVASYIKTLKLSSDDELHSLLEAAILKEKRLDLKAEYRSYYLHEFHLSLLSAMGEDTLSTSAKRILAEAERRIGTERRERAGIIGGTIGSPIPEDRIAYMSDEQWLKAIAKYTTEKSDLRTLRGGVSQLSRALEDAAKQDPERFVELAQKLPDTAHHYYPSALLRALGSPDVIIKPESIFAVIRTFSKLQHPEIQRWIGWPLQRLDPGIVSDDIVHILLDKACEPLIQSDDEDSYRDDGSSIDSINHPQGACIHVLADMAYKDSSGRIAKLIAPSLLKLAADPSPSVKVGTARLISVCLRYDEKSACSAFDKLVETPNLNIFSAQEVVSLLSHVTSLRMEKVKELLPQIMAHNNNDSQRLAGQLSAYLGLAKGQTQLLTQAVESPNEKVRVGAGQILANMYLTMDDKDAITEIILNLVNDDSQDVREFSHDLMANLRGEELCVHEHLLISLINSEAFSQCLPQLILTIQEAPDQVDDIAIACAAQFISRYKEEIGDISTSAAGDSQSIAQLLFKAYARADQKKREEIIDLLDSMLRYNAYGVGEMIGLFEK